MRIAKVFAYQYIVKAKRDGVTGELTWSVPNEKIDQLMLGIPWQESVKLYSKRARFYWGFSFAGDQEDLFPILDGKWELSEASLEEPEYTIEMAVFPTKLSTEQGVMLDDLVKNSSDDNNFKFWWDDDIRGGPRERSAKAKKKIIAEYEQLPKYDGSEDLTLEDSSVTVKQALELFGFDSEAKSKVVSKLYKLKYKQLQLKHHPDNTDTGDKQMFMFLQKCKIALEEWIDS